MKAAQEFIVAVTALLGALLGLAADTFAYARGCAYVSANREP